MHEKNLLKENHENISIICPLLQDNGSCLFGQLMYQLLLVFLPFGTKQIWLPIVVLFVILYMNFTSASNNCIVLQKTMTYHRLYNYDISQAIQL